MLFLSLVVVLIAKLAAGEVDPHIQEMYETLSTEEFIWYFNNLNLSFTITKHDMKPFTGGILPPSEIDFRTVDNIEHTDSLDLPDNFDARENWPQCVTIQDIYEQESCGSCWTFGVATTASDRTCIHQGITVRLSNQDLECCKDCLANITVCQGGDPLKAFQFWISEGLVSQDCKPYDIEALQRAECAETCVNGNDYTTDKRKGSNVYVVNPDDASIKTELFKNGPLEATFVVYEDFHDHYSTGVYEHTYGKFLGYHSVRVIGYGVENGESYWLAVNTWGTTWGENGYFKWKRFQDQSLGFEDTLLSSFP